MEHRQLRAILTPNALGKPQRGDINTAQGNALGTAHINTQSPTRWASPNGATLIQPRATPQCH